MKLQIKVPLMVTGILVLIGIIAGGMMLFFQQRASVKQFEHMALGLSGAVLASLEQSMLIGDPSYTQETMMRIIKQEKLVTELTLYNSEGFVAAASEVTQLSQKGNLNELDDALSSGKTSIYAEQRSGLHELSVITPVTNKDECQSCHNKDVKVLGAVKVSLDASFVGEQARQQTMFLIILAGVTFIIIGGGLALTLKVTTLNRLSRLVQITERISQGDYSNCAEDDRTDEIGRLGNAFNDMTAKVERRNRDLAQWNANLETSIQQRTKEITSLNTKLEEMNHIREQVLKRLITAQEEERRRIARELHDDASQSLAAIALNLENIMEDIPSENRIARERLAVLKKEVIETMTGIRELAIELRPTILDELGLARAIKSFTKDYLGKRGIDFSVIVNGPDVKLPIYSETMLFRITQEALTNVVKHSKASQVVVELSLTAASAVLRVKDNGQGFDTKSALGDSHLQQSLGIHSMSERSTLLGGIFRIESDVGKGTIVSVEIPITKGGNHG